MPPPTKTLRSQNGNSCAAHCTVIAIDEMLQIGLGQGYAEKTLWPSIQFKPTGGMDETIDALAQRKNSDPRRIVHEAKRRWNVKATLKCDETQKNAALKFVSDGMKPRLEALFNMLKGHHSAPTITLEEGVYYNSSFLMFEGDANANCYSGMHNILVMKDAGTVYYYNPNEDNPKWSIEPDDWKTLEGQNGGKYSYVFTGVCVEMKKDPGAHQPQGPFADVLRQKRLGRNQERV